MISLAGPGELVAAVGAAPGADDAGPAQLGEDVLEEVLRDVLALGEVLALHRHAVRLGGGELDRRPHRVVRLGRDPHRSILRGWPGLDESLSALSPLSIE